MPTITIMRTLQLQCSSSLPEFELLSLSLLSPTTVLSLVVGCRLWSAAVLVIDSWCPYCFISAAACVVLTGISCLGWNQPVAYSCWVPCFELLNGHCSNCTCGRVKHIMTTDSKTTRTTSTTTTFESLTSTYTTSFMTMVHTVLSINAPCCWVATRLIQVAWSL